MWSIEYYQSGGGRFPVAEEFGIDLGMPYARYLGKQLRELRIRYERNRYRVVYFLAAGDIFVLLHGFTKKARAVSRKDMEIAERRRDDYLFRRR